MPVTVTKDASDFRSLETVTLRLDNYDLEGFGEEQLTGGLVMSLTDGTVIESAPYTVTMRQMLEQVNGNVDKYSSAQILALRNMLAGLQLPWQLDNILAVQ